MHISVLFAHIFFGFLLVSTNGMCWKIPGGSIEGVHSDSTTRSDVVCCWIFLDLFFPINMWDIWLPPRKPLRNPYVLIVFKELISIKRCVFDADWPRAGSKFSMTSTEGLWDPIGWSAGSLPLAWIKKTSRQGSGIMGIMVRTLPPKATKTNGFLTNLKPWFGWVGWVCFAKKVFVMMRTWLDILLITIREDSRLKPSLRFPSRCFFFLRDTIYWIIRFFCFFRAIQMQLAFLFRICCFKIMRCAVQFHRLRPWNQLHDCSSSGWCTWDFVLIGRWGGSWFYHWCYPCFFVSRSWTSWSR